jgi:hypothetical protein
MGAMLRNRIITVTSAVDRIARNGYESAMKMHFPKILGLSLVLLTLCAARADEPKAPKGFKVLFNGKNFKGWHGVQRDLDPRKLDAMPADEKAKKMAEWEADFKKHWRVENNELVNDGQGPYATTDKDFSDIELLIDYKTVPKADSGIYLRGTPQVQIWDYTDTNKFKYGSDKGSGALWNNSPGKPGKDPLVLADKPFGEWNHFRIIQVGDVTTVYLNDKLVVDHAVMENYWDRSKPLIEKGPIQLQTHGGEIRWRNIFIREIPKKEAKQILEKAGYKQKALAK